MANIMNMDYGGGDMHNEYNRLMMQRTPIGITGMVEQTPIDRGQIYVERKPVFTKGNVNIPDEVVSDNRYFLRAPGWAWPEDMDATTEQSLGGMNPANLFATKNTMPASADYLLAAQLLLNKASQRKG